MLANYLLILLLIQKSQKQKKKIPNHAKYFVTTNFNKFPSETFNAKLKIEKLATNKDLANVELCY